MVLIIYHSTTAYRVENYYLQLILLLLPLRVIYSQGENTFIYTSVFGTAESWILEVAVLAGRRETLQTQHRRKDSGYTDKLFSNRPPGNSFLTLPCDVTPLASSRRLLLGKLSTTHNQIKIVSGITEWKANLWYDWSMAALRSKFDLVDGNGGLGRATFEGLGKEQHLWTVDKYGERGFRSSRSLIEEFTEKTKIEKLPEIFTFVSFLLNKIDVLYKPNYYKKVSCL